MYEIKLHLEEISTQMYLLRILLQEAFQIYKYTKYVVSGKSHSINIQS